MCDIRVMNRDFLTEFIKIYKEEECLWKLSSPDYLNKFLKKAAYARLVQKLREVEKHADEHMVKRKIYSMRNNYRSEMKKVKKTMLTATFGDDIHRPTLWYFDLLDFLRDQEVPRRSNATKVIDMENDYSQLGSEYSLNSDAGMSILEPETAIITPDSPPPQIIRFNKSESSRKKKISTESSLHLEDILEKVNCRLNSRKDDDDSDIFGKHIAGKLRKLSPRMQFIAEKLISDVIFYAQTETLDMDSRVMLGASAYNHKTESDVLF